MAGQIPVDISQTTAVKCKKCDGQLFDISYYLRKVSGLLTGSMKDTIVDIPVPVCRNCGTPIEAPPGDTQEAEIVEEDGS